MKVGKSKEKKAGALKISIIAIDKLKPSSVQPRLTFNDEKMNELAASIAVHGVLQPLIVKEAGAFYEIIAGERRWRAASMARLKKLPCTIMDLVTEQALAIALVENVQREDLNPIEEAMAYARLRETLKLNQDEIAERVGKDRSSVANMLRLLRLPKSVREMLISGELSMGHARALLSLDSEEMMFMVAKKTIREGMSVRRAEALIRSVKKGFSLFDAKKGASPGDDPMERAIRQGLEYKIGTKVDLKKQGDGYTVTLNFSNIAELNLLLELLDIEI